jgi:hypothetical protein
LPSFPLREEATNVVIDQVLLHCTDSVEKNSVRKDAIFEPSLLFFGQITEQITDYNVPDLSLKLSRHAVADSHTGVRLTKIVGL